MSTISIKCEVTKPIEVSIESDYVEGAIEGVLARELNYVIRGAVTEQIQKLVEELMVPHREALTAKIQEQLKSELDAIIVGRRR